MDGKDFAWYEKCSKGTFSVLLEDGEEEIPGSYLTILKGRKLYDYGFNEGGKVKDLDSWVVGSARRR